MKWHIAELFDALHRIESLDRDAYEIVKRWVDLTVEKYESTAPSDELKESIGQLNKKIEMATMLSEKLTELADEVFDAIGDVEDKLSDIEHSLTTEIENAGEVLNQLSQFTIIA